MSTLLRSSMLVAALATVLAASAPSPAGAAESEGRRSPFGSIAFVSARTGEDEIHLLDLRSGATSRLTRNPHGPDRAPAWSPDGRSIAFNSRRRWHASQPEIYVLRLGADRARRVTRNAAEDQRAAFTPDGASVVHQRGDFASGFALWRTDVAGGAERKLTEIDGGSFDVAPDPSPVDDALLLQTNRGSGGLFPFHLALMRPGEAKPQIIRTEATGSVDGPRWSPDGRRIAFAAGGELYVLERESGRLDRLTTDRHDDLSPDWSPDGGSIVFQSDRRVKTGGLHVIDLDSRRIWFLREGRTPVWTARRHDLARR